MIINCYAPILASMNPLEKAALIAKQNTKHAKAGWSVLGRACGVSYGRVRQWSEEGRLPMTVLCGLQDHHERIAEVVNHEVTAEELRAWTEESWKAHYAKKAAA